jgi:hypothetical protein
MDFHFTPIFLLGIVVCLSACTGAQMQAARMQKTTVATVAEAKSCVDNVYAKPEYASLEKRLFLTSDPTAQIPLEYLTDKSKPTKPEIADLYKVHSDTQPCRKIALDGMAAVHPLIVATLVDSYSATDRLWVDAVSGKLTWGAINESRQTLINEYRGKLTEAGARIEAQLQNQHQFELEQRQRAAAAMQQWAYQQQQLYQNQQMINALNRPHTINCNYLENTAQCSY